MKKANIIKKNLDFDRIIKNKYDSVYISIGSQLSKKIDIKGINSKGVYYAIDVLNDIAKGNLPKYNNKNV